MSWIRIAKENLPAMNNGSVSTDRIAEMSALLDRLHHQAARLSLPATASAAQRKAA